MNTVQGQHTGAVVSTVTSQQEGTGFKTGSGRFHAEFACSPCGFLSHAKNMQTGGYVNWSLQITHSCVCLYMSTL